MGGSTRTARAVVAAFFVGSLGGCALYGGGADEDVAAVSVAAPNASPEQVAVAEFNDAVGCVSSSQLALQATNAAGAAALGFKSNQDAVAAEFGPMRDRAVEISKAATSDAIEKGGARDIEEDEVRKLFAADYARLLTEFKSVAGTQPALATYTIRDRLQRCDKAYPSG